MIDSRDWIEDLNVHVEDQEIEETVRALEPILAYGGSKAFAGVWIAFASLLAGAFAGVTLSRDIRDSAVAFIIYLAASFVVLRWLAPASRRLFGSAISWLAGISFFWSLILAGSAVAAGHIDRTWLAYLVSGGMGTLVGLVHGSLPPENVKHRNAWMLVSLPLGPISTIQAMAFYRSVFSASGSALATATTGVLAAALFAVPMCALLVWWWSDAHALSRMAMVLLHNENFAPKAIAYLDRAIALDPDDADLYNLRGIAWSKLDEPQRAVTDWEKVAELKPKNPIPHMNRGTDFLRSGALEDAIHSLEIAVRIAPDHAMSHSNLGAALERSGQFSRAIEHYDRAIELLPNYANAYSNRSYAHFRCGDYERALRDAKRALKLDARLAMAHVNHGHALRALGDSSGAADSYRAALDLQPAPVVWDEAAAALERLQSEQPA
jgi:tetratricopeptide (TPR) repeat protein